MYVYVCACWCGCAVCVNMLWNHQHMRKCLSTSDSPKIKKSCYYLSFLEASFLKSVILSHLEDFPFFLRSKMISKCKFNNVKERGSHLYFQSDSMNCFFNLIGVRFLSTIGAILIWHTLPIILKNQRFASGGIHLIFILFDVLVFYVSCFLRSFNRFTSLTKAQKVADMLLENYA